MANNAKIRPPGWEQMVKEACEAANNDPETQKIQREMGALPDTMTDEWEVIP